MGMHDTLSVPKPAVMAAMLLSATIASCAYVGSVSVPATPAIGPHLVALDADACRTLLRDDASAASLQRAVARSTEYLRKVPADHSFTVLDKHVVANDLLGMLTALADTAPSTANWSQAVCERFRVYQAVLPQPLLVTGYYEPELAASRNRTERFRYPLYRTPDDLVDVDLGQFCAECSQRVAKGRVQSGKLVPYYSRAEIDAGALEGRGYEIAWLDDPVEEFFLHVQGSALLRFQDGVHMEISYSSSNGLPYTSLGSVLIAQGKVPHAMVSLQVLKDYLRAHPEEQRQLMAANQRYIFFRAVAAGAVGSLGVPLTEGRSIAADPKQYPPGALLFVRIAARDQPSAASRQPTVSRFALIQDAGTAISGPSRVDVFWGTGATAEAIAGDMHNPGELYLVLPK
jgi:membrane-bound lytic murein transglycosylase A